MSTEITSPEKMPTIRATPGYNAARYFVAFFIVLYGFAKLMGAQFTVLDSELDKPMGEVSGFWLAWYFFGYSPVFGNLLALIQVAAGLMLTFRRTTLLAACVLFAMLSNIVLIDVFFRVDLGGLLMAMVLWAAVTAILWSHRRQLAHVFWTSQPDALDIPRSGQVVRMAARGAMLVVAAAGMYYIANFNNRVPTPLDGRWDVVEVSGAEPDLLPSHIYFERNRAFMAVFRYPDEWVTHHFEIDSKARRLTIWRDWLSRGGQILDGVYVLAGDDLMVTGTLTGADDEVTLRLVRTSPPLLPR